MSSNLHLPSSSSIDVKEAFRFCESLVAAHYENFPVASFFLPKSKRKYIASIYAFARTADDYADEPGDTPSDRLEKLSAWEEQLNRCYRGEATNPVFIALRETVQKFGIPEVLFQRLLNAFIADVTTNRYETFSDVRAYCRNSAEPVGRLVLLVFGYTDESLMLHSDEICTALQLTNFWQDVSVDLDKDRVYIPLEDLRRFGIDEERLLSRSFSPEIQKAIEFEILRTRELFWEGEPLLGFVGRDLSLELKLTWNGGMKILCKIERAGCNVFRRPTLSTIDKISILLQSLF